MELIPVGSRNSSTVIGCTTANINSTVLVLFVLLVMLVNLYLCVIDVTVAQSISESLIVCVIVVMVAQSIIESLLVCD